MLRDDCAEQLSIARRSERQQIARLAEDQLTLIDEMIATEEAQDRMIS